MVHPSLEYQKIKRNNNVNYYPKRWIIHQFFATKHLLPAFSTLTKEKGRKQLFILLKLLTSTQAISDDELEAHYYVKHKSYVFFSFNGLHKLPRVLNIACYDSCFIILILLLLFASHNACRETERKNRMFSLLSFTLLWYARSFTFSWQRWLCSIICFHSALFFCAFTFTKTSYPYIRYVIVRSTRKYPCHYYSTSIPSLLSIDYYLQFSDAATINNQT